MTELLEKESQAPLTGGEDDVRYYLSEIREFPRLTAQQERELARRCAQGDGEAIRQMVNANLRLVVSVAREYAGRGVALLDLIQEGSIGLLVAARKFDVDRELRFSTYATKWIRQGVSRCLLNHGGVIRVPLHTAERMRRIQAARNALLAENREEPTAEEIAQRTGMAPRKVREILALTPEVCSLDVTVGEEEDVTLAALLEDVQALQPQEGLIRRELERIIRDLLATLDDRQRQILKLHYGLEDGSCYSLEEIGRMLGISKERVRQIEHQAMEKLRKVGISVGLEDFLE